MARWILFLICFYATSCATTHQPAPSTHRLEVALTATNESLFTFTLRNHSGDSLVILKNSFYLEPQFEVSQGSREAEFCGLYADRFFRNSEILKGDDLVLLGPLEDYKIPVSLAEIVGNYKVTSNSFSIRYDRPIEYVVLKQPIRSIRAARFFKNEVMENLRSNTLDVRLSDRAWEIAKAQRDFPL